MPNIFNEVFASKPLPTVDEVRREAKRLPVLFPAADAIDETWILRSQLYQFLFGLLLMDKTGLVEVDEYLANHDVKPLAWEGRGFFQRYDRMGLTYIYVRTFARVERLGEDKLAILDAAHAGDDEAYAKALDMVEATFARVMAVCPDRPDTTFEPMMTLNRMYAVHGNEIPLAVRCIADYDTDGNIRSKEAEENRLKLMGCIAGRLDGILTRDLGCPTRTAMEV